MVDQLKTILEKNGIKFEVVSASRIEDLRKGIEDFQSQTELNGFQKWIVNNLYKFKLPDNTRSIIIAAIPHLHSYACIVFNRNGKEYKIYGSVTAPLVKAKKQIMDAVKKMGFQISSERNLPLKRLAVQSGLAEYGKNNITYVNGMGSFLNYLAFFSNMPCDSDSWRDVAVSTICNKCEECAKSCPTGAIDINRFLIDNQRCLSAINENTSDFPDWLPSTAHHTAYDCLKCQTCCPMNADKNDIIEIMFSEKETERLIEGRPYKDSSNELKKKISLLGLDSWPSIPRNLLSLFDLMDKGHIPSLNS